MIAIAFGSNLPGRFSSSQHAISQALAALAEHNIVIKTRSGYWKTRPDPPSDQPWYINGAFTIDTDHSAHSLLAILKETEVQMGRKQSIRNASRVIDLDLLTFHDAVLETLMLQLPHPRLHARPFVLYPLAEIAPDWVHPVLGKNVQEMIKTLPSEHIHDITPL